MSTRFFASVRRNQKQWMVVVTVLSMVSFLFLDDSVRGNGAMSPTGGSFLIGLLCASGMCIIGYPRQKTVEYGLGGLIVGFVAGFIGFGAAGGNRPVVRTAAGNLTRSELDDLARKRMKLNQFLSAASNKTQARVSYFGSPEDESIILQRLLLADAKKMGIHITDERVNEYLTNLKLSKKDYRDCLRETHMGETELFDLLKSELSAQLVLELTEAPAYVPQIPPMFAQYIQQMNESPRYMQETPQQLWSVYQKMTVKESLQVAAIPVADFVSKVSDPSEFELSAFFDKYKHTPWQSETSPGFLQLPRVQLAYLTGDFEKFEKGIEPTDAEIQAYYEKNKDRYRAPLAKESTAPKLPDSEIEAPKPDAPPTGDKPDANAKPKEEPKPEPAAGDEKNKPADEAKPEAKPEVKPESKPEADPKSNCGEEGAATDKPAAKSDEPAAKDEKKQEVAGEKPEAKPDQPKVADDKPEAQPEAKPAPKADAPAPPAKSEEPKGDKPDAPLPKLSDSPEALPAPRYRELNDDLKLEIRDVILKERTHALIAAELDKALEFMKDLGIEYDAVTKADEKKEMAKTVAEKLKAYAADHKLEYKETAELTYAELSEEPLGKASNVKNQGRVADETFTPGANGEPKLPLYAANRADLRALGGEFAYWKIANLPEAVLDLKTESVHKLAVSAWKFDQARSLAEQRAKELAAKVKSDGNDFPATMSGESVTGVKTDPAITIIPTEPFTWLSMNRSVPNAGGSPMITMIPLIPNINDGFMKTVFDDLNVGETGVAVDAPRAVFYVVKVVDREFAKDEDGGVARLEHRERFMHEEFTNRMFPIMKSAYQAMAQYPQRAIDAAWQQKFRQEHHVAWEEDTTPRRSRK